VTDINAGITQQVLYAPFGEVITEYNAYWHNGLIPDFTFNAKEYDEENGMYYYEARYYNPPTFISRDPLFEKYPWMSPYAYTMNNPLKFIDPTGEDVEIVCPETNQKVQYTPGMAIPEGSSKFVSDAITGLNFLYNNSEGNNNRIATIAESETLLTVKQQTVGSSSRYNPYNQELSWDNQSADVFVGGSQSAVVGLAHEIDHASISIPAWDGVTAYERGGNKSYSTYVQNCGDAKLVTLPGDMRYENSAISYESFIGNLSVGGNKLSTYQRTEYIPPIMTVKTNSIFSTAGRK
jgi:RHS repeat-associated protein